VHVVIQYFSSSIWTSNHFQQTKNWLHGFFVTFEGAIHNKVCCCSSSAGIQKEPEAAAFTGFVMGSGS
jgi:hypothetical protein